MYCIYIHMHNIHIYKCLFSLGNLCGFFLCMWHVRVCTYRCIHIHTHIHIYIYICIPFLLSYLWLALFYNSMYFARERGKGKYTYMYIYAYMHACISIYVYIYTFFKIILAFSTLLLLIYASHALFFYHFCFWQKSYFDPQNYAFSKYPSNSKNNPQIGPYRSSFCFFFLLFSLFFFWIFVLYFFLLLLFYYLIFF